jgi:hypothetical protein
MDNLIINFFFQGFEIPDQDGDSLNNPSRIVQYVCDKYDVFH